MRFGHKDRLKIPTIVFIIIAFCVICCAATGCSTMWTIEADYHPMVAVHVPDQAELQRRWQLFVLPVRDSRMIPETVQLKFKDTDPGKIIGWWGQLSNIHVFRLKRPFAEVFSDAVVYEFKRAGYVVNYQHTSGNDTKLPTFYLECILKYAHATFLQGPTVETWSMIRIGYRIKNSDGDVIHDGYLGEKLINKEGLISSPTALGELLINKCLPKLIEKLIIEVVSCINARP